MRVSNPSMNVKFLFALLLSSLSHTPCSLQTVLGVSVLSNAASLSNSFLLGSLCNALLFQKCVFCQRYHCCSLRSSSDEKFEKPMEKQCLQCDFTVIPFTDIDGGATAAGPAEFCKCPHDKVNSLQSEIQDYTLAHYNCHDHLKFAKLLSLTKHSILVVATRSIQQKRSQNVLCICMVYALPNQVSTDMWLNSLAPFFFLETRNRIPEPWSFC